MKFKILFVLTLISYALPSRVSAVNLAEHYAFGGYTSLGDLLSVIVPLGFVIGGILVSFYTIMGAYDLIMSQGDKNQIVAARNKILHGIIGLVLLVAMFVALRYLPTVLGLSDGFSIIGM